MYYKTETEVSGKLDHSKAENKAANLEIDKIEFKKGRMTELLEE